MVTLVVEFMACDSCLLYLLDGLMSQQITAQGMNGPLTHYFRYDALNRVMLTSENPSNTTNPACPDGASQWCQQFSYDAFGNRTVSQSSNIGTVTGQPMNFNPVNNRITDNGYGYDAAGNLNLAPTGFTFAYDAENRLAVGCPNDPTPSNCVSTAANGRTLYGYDGDGKRVTRQTADGTVTTFVYDAIGDLSAEYTSTPVAPAVAGTIYLTTDHLGSTRVVTDSSATPVAVARHDYRPFGEEISFNATNPRHGVQGYAQDAGVRQEFTSKEQDAETGLDHFGARYFSGAQGRFTSPDPMIGWPDDPQRWNMYTYGRNDPLSYVDPDGQDYFEICGIDGKDCGRYNEDQYTRLRKDQSFIVANGKIYARNENGTQGEQLGTVTRIGTGLDDRGDAVVAGLAARADASKKLIGIVAAASVAAGVIAGAVLATGGAAVVQSTVTLGANIGARLLPIGITTAHFGREIMRWGTGNAQATARMATVTLEEIQAAGVTRQMAASWRDFYSYVAQTSPSNPSAAGRAQLMQHVVDLFDKGK